MVTGVLESVGAAVGVAGLIAACKGAIDGYLLIETIFDEDNGLRDLVLDYNIEREKLTSWGDRFKVNAAREEDCLFHREREPIKALMAEIFGRIEYFHGQAKLFIQVHEVSDHRIDYKRLAAPSTGFHKFVQIHSDQVRAMSKAQMEKRQKQRVKLAIKNRAKFEEIVRRLRKANEDLLALLNEPSLDAYMRALPTYVLAHTNTSTKLQEAQRISGAGNDLIRQAARLKMLQSTGVSGCKATKIDSLLVEPTTTPDTHTAVRKISIYNKVARIWLEWLEIDRNLSPVETSNIQARIRTLSLMLETTPESFRIARCIGYMDDQSNAYRMGLVYRTPKGTGAAVPTSLLAMIKQHKVIGTPPLVARFKLAQTLATTLMQLHASNWLHKAFRSDNILFFTTPPLSTNAISNPHLAGFEYARDTHMQSIGTRPTGQGELDYYYHPDVINGFTKTLDLYSLGVVLLEIAHWRPLSSKIPAKDAKSLQSIRQLFIDSSDERLDAAVGSIYAGVVRMCLNCAFPDPRCEEAEFACAMNAEVVVQLEECVA